MVRYVGPGEDERHLLVETVEGDEKFSLYITDELRRAASIDLPRLTQVAGRQPGQPARDPDAGARRRVAARRSPSSPACRSIG